jgi:malonyl-CoA O-methyltransferase
MMQTINNKIQRGFNKSAGQYDLFSSLHRDIADKLLSQVINQPAPSAILDVGCGTGYLTIKAQESFPQSKIIGLDFAEGMLKVARSKQKDIHWILADGQDLPFSNEHFDIVLSNLAYQWAQPLSRAFSQARRVLIPKGVLACTLFGYHSCQELFQSLDEASRGELKFARLPDRSQVQEALISGGFKGPRVDSEQIKIEFGDMYALINWFKLIGAPHLPPQLFTKKRFACDGGVYATFEVIGVYAKA